MVLEVHRCVGGNCNVILVPHGGGWVHNPDDIYRAIVRSAKEKKSYPDIIRFKEDWL